MAPRLLPLAVALGCVVAELTGGRGAAYGLLLLAIPFCAAAVLTAVGNAAEERGGAFPVTLEVASLAIVVTAASLRAPLLAVSCLAPFALHGAAPIAARLRRSSAVPRERRRAERARAVA